MKHEILQQFTTVVDFLGNVLGPDYEVTLYNLEIEDYPLVAISNGRLSGQTEERPLSEIVREILDKEQYEEKGYILNFTSCLQSSGKTIRSSAMLVKNSKGKPVGLLRINFDDSRYLSLCSQLLELVHPDAFLQAQYAGEHRMIDMPEKNKTEKTARGEAVHNDVAALIREIFAEEEALLEVPADRLTQEERIEVIARLKKRGLFRLKGGVQYTAERLACSQASVYRYMGKIKE